MSEWLNYSICVFNVNDKTLYYYGTYAENIKKTSCFMFTRLIIATVLFYKKHRMRV